jgi:excisionase family DNA binding protein
MVIGMRGRALARSRHCLARTDLAGRREAATLQGADFGYAPLSAWAAGIPRGLLLSPTEAAAHLSIGRSKVYELMRLGQLRSVKIGASRRIPQAALADFIATLVKEPQ